MTKRKMFWILICAAGIAGQGLLLGQTTQEPDKKDGKEPSNRPGHSVHGEIFNEGPRQKAYLMGDTANIHFPVTTKHPQVQQFIEQGIGQLHGYWYFEAERSFRQAAMLDPNCAIAYWGMAMANLENNKRGKGFIKEAVQRKAKATEREGMYIQAANDYLNATGKEAGKKIQKIVEAHEKIAKEYPDDLEAQAFLCYFLHKYRGSVKKSYEDVEAEIQKVLDQNPLHPVHHYNIHLWDYKNAARALKSSALGGPSAPGIAHMWHMPGHIYSQLKRYEDAVWQQEASARVDHKYMMQNLVLPDQIHNYAHNNEWLIRNLIFIGKHKDAVAVAKNMSELPRHPKYNKETGRGSSYYGRLRLFEVLTRFELWGEVIFLADTPYLEPTSVEAEQIKRLRLLGIAYARTEKYKDAEKILSELEQRLTKLEPGKGPGKPGDTGKVKTGTGDTAKAKGGDAEKTKEQPGTGKSGKESPMKQPKTPGGKGQPGKGPKGKKPSAPNKSNIEQAINVIKGHMAFAQKDYKQAVDLLRKGGEDTLVIALAQCLAGEKDAAAKIADGQVKSRNKETVPLANAVEILWLAGKKKEAEETFKTLQKISSSIQFGSPVFDRLAPIAKELKLPGDWRAPKTVASDIGPRPKHDDLGPLCWQPSPAPKWALHDAYGQTVSLNQYKGKPVIVIFYLGHSCLHCAEQLQAFAPMTEQFKKEGIELVAISTDDEEGLKVSLKSCKDGKFPFPLLTNARLDVFKAYRAYDDFENSTLHGTFLIDGDGLIRWLDISYEPFMDVNFVLNESKRLLGLSKACCCCE